VGLTESAWFPHSVALQSTSPLDREPPADHDGQHDQRDGHGLQGVMRSSHCGRQRYRVALKGSFSFEMKMV
jgi:hypothetical protein